MLFAASISIEADPPAGKQLQRADRWEMGWAVPATTYLNYTVSYQRRVEPAEPIEGATLVEPDLDYAHFLGHEISPAGELASLAAPLPFVEALLQPALYLSPGKHKAGSSWKRDWDLSSIYREPGLQLTGEYTLSGAEQCGNVDCVAVASRHTLKPPGKGAPTGAHWQNFDLGATAWFDPEAGRLQGALLELRAQRVTPGSDGAKDQRDVLNWTVRFDLKREFDTTADRYLHERVRSAITKGVERIWSQLRGDGLWPHGNHKRGGTALALLTLLMCDVSPEESRVKRGFELLKDLDTEDTYSVACSLMAYEARYISEEERRGYLSNPENPPVFKRDVSEEDRAEMERLVQWIAENRNESNPFYNYNRPEEGGNQRFDFSNTQYALLGLAAALRCDIRVPPGIVKPMLDELPKYQQQAGPKIRRVIGYKPPERDEDGREGRATMATRMVEARGWTYSRKSNWSRQTEVGDAYGSMTTAGLTCLLAGLDIAQNMTPEDFKAEFGNRTMHLNWERRANESLDHGMAWMEHWFSVTRNPYRARHWWLYYMYGLERIMMMAGQRYLGTHNWYNEGAAVLVVTQDDMGGWGNTADTCFALLFLKKGSVPNRRRVVTGD